MSCTNHLSELEVLRLQVADLSRKLVEREQSMSAEHRDLVETIQDLRKQSRLKKRGSDQKIGQIEQVMDEIETIASDLDALLAGANHSDVE